MNEDVWSNYECEGQMSIFDYELKNIDDHLKSCREDADVYVYSFSKAEVEHINRALQRYDLVKEIRQLIEEQNK